MELAPGATDADVLGLANRERALLLTGDKDFGDLVYRLQQAHHGVILLRLAGLPPLDKAQLVARIVEMRRAELPHSFTVITARSVRIRRRR